MQSMVKTKMDMEADLRQMQQQIVQQRSELNQLQSSMKCGEDD